MFYLMDDAIKNVGVYPQVTEMNPKFDWEAFSKANWEFNPLLSTTVPAPKVLPMRPGAKVTDALSVVNPAWPCLAVNEKLLHFIQSIRADPLRVMPTTAVKKGISYLYWLVAIDIVRAEYVNYQESRFVLSNISEWLEDIKIENAEEYKRLAPKYTYPIYLRATKLVLNEEAIQHDIFRLPRFTSARYFVSEQFREGIEKEKITGLRFDPIESVV